MQLRYWGTRGSIASPGPETQRYGGNTPCVEVRGADDTLFIFDCGTGARSLGLELARRGPVRAHLFLGHTHADHIQGLPFFVPAFVPGSELTIYGPAGIGRSLQDVVAGLMDYSYFPVPLAQLPARIDFVELHEETLQIGSATIRTQYLNHTAPCLGYRVSLDGAVLAYVTDHEPFASPTWRQGRRRELDPAAMVHEGDARHVELLRDADLVIHDAQYTTAEYRKKHGWGHSPVDYVVDVALAAGARELSLFHHDPTRSDAEIDTLVRAFTEHIGAFGRELVLSAAAEGTQVELRGTARTVVAPVPSATPLAHTARVLVAEDDAATLDALDELLVADGYEVSRAHNGDEALALARKDHYDLLLLDRRMPGLDGLAVCRAIRADPTQREVPVVMLSASDDPLDIAAGFADGATDYITKPFMVSQLRARVRSWLTRANAADQRATEAVVPL